MKSIINKKALLKALESLKGITKKSRLYPILENVRLTTLENTLLLRATDLRTSISYTIPKEDVYILNDGELLLPSLELYNIIKETPDIEVMLESEVFNGKLTTEGGIFCILGENPQKFPEMPEFDEKGTIEISGDDFKKLIKKTLFATTSEKTRYDLDNVLIEIIGDVIRFVSTDGKRIAICEKKYIAFTEIIDNRFTVPALGLQQIEKVISATKPEKVTLSFSESQLIFRTNDVLLIIQLSEVRFPPYEKVIPIALPYKAIIPSKEFLSVLKRICFLTDKKNKTIEIFFSNGKIDVFPIRDNNVTGNFTLPVEYNGNDLSIKFNPNFLLDFLKVIDSKKISISLESKEHAILLQDDDDFRYILLPKLEKESNEVIEVQETDSILYKAYRLYADMKKNIC